MNTLEIHFYIINMMKTNWKLKTRLLDRKKEKKKQKKRKEKKEGVGEGGEREREREYNYWNKLRRGCNPR